MKTIPETMAAAAIDRFGRPEVLTRLPVPDLDDDDVLIELDAAERRRHLGCRDAAGGLHGGGTIPGPTAPAPVTAVGSKVRRFKADEQVYSYSFQNPRGGFYAEYVAVAASKVAPVSRTLDLEHAGAIRTTGLTALQGIDDILHIKMDESLIIHGASGGVGTLAIQFANVRGARVLAP